MYLVRKVLFQILVYLFFVVVVVVVVVVIVVVFMVLLRFLCFLIMHLPIMNKVRIKTQFYQAIIF